MATTATPEASVEHSYTTAIPLTPANPTGASTVTPGGSNAPTDYAAYRCLATTYRGRGIHRGHHLHVRTQALKIAVAMLPGNLPAHDRCG